LRNQLLISDIKLIFANGIAFALLGLNPTLTVLLSATLLSTSSMKKLLAVLTLAAAASAPAATVINFADFSDVSTLQLNGNASQAGNRLRVTPAAGSQAGSAFSQNAVTLTASVSFSTHFAFQITNSGGGSDGDGPGADGLVFVVQTVSNTAGTGGGGIGYLGLPNSVGIEFDTWNNGGGSNDPNGNHIGIDIGGGFNGPTALIGTRMNDGNIWNAWVDYNGVTDDLEVRLSQTSTRPAAATLTRNVDLVSVLGGTNAFVGFTSGTGAAWGNHDVLSWEFRDDFAPISSPDSGGTLALFGAGLTSMAFLRRMLSRRKA
jgi:hypothetical protein